MKKKTRSAIANRKEEIIDYFMKRSNEDTDATILTFGKHNECEKQDGISPDRIVYCGLSKDISLLAINAILTNANSEIIHRKIADGLMIGEDHCLIYSN